MKPLFKMTLSAIIAAGFLSVSPFLKDANAGWAQGDYERALNCKQMRRSGTLEWYSIASGTVDTGGGRNGYSGFVTKACHSNQASCQRWVRRIGHEIANLDTIEVAYCKRAR